MMRQLREQLPGRLGGADIEAAIHQRGIDAHDLDRRRLRQVDGPVALAATRGAGKQIHRKLQRGIRAGAGR